MNYELYIRYGKSDYYYGSFPNRERAEAHYRLIRAKLESEYGSDITPIYVESGKGRRKQ